MEDPGVPNSPLGSLLLALSVTVIFQVALYAWQKKHRRSYLAVSLAGLWLIPIFIAISFSNIYFIIMWCIYSTFMGLIFKKATRKPLESNTPRYVTGIFDSCLTYLYRAVYRFFNIVFHLTMIVGITAYSMFLANLFAILSTTLFEFSLTLIFYALYFGVLSRDMIDLASEMMAASLGVMAQHSLG